MSRTRAKSAPPELTKHPPPSDPTLQHPNCVYQIMRRHYARYTPEMVERVTGCPQRVVPAHLRGHHSQFGA